MALLEFSDKGIYCPQADIYIDPWRSVAKALITHAHSDHARWGMGAYLCTHEAAPVLRHRLGSSGQFVESIAYQEGVYINGVRFSFHPAGHITGSAQIRVEYQGEIWVVSGDYKTENDGISGCFEPVKCHTFITESTFGLPVYQWQAQQNVFDEINRWWADNSANGLNSVILAYSLGKSQRILHGIDASIGEIYAHTSVENINSILRQQGFDIPFCSTTEKLNGKTSIKGALVIAPPSVADTPWIRKFGQYRMAIASGWMALRGARRRRAADKGFVLSDHADWQGLQSAVAATEATTVYVTHGYSDIFAQWLCSKGLDGRVVQTAYTGESVDNEKNDISENAKEPS